MAGDGTSDDDDLLVGGGGVRESLALLVREGSKTVLPIQQAWPLRLQRPVAYQKLYHERTSAGCPWLSSPPAFLRDDIVRCSPLQRPTGTSNLELVYCSKLVFWLIGSWVVNTQHYEYHFSRQSTASPSPPPPRLDSLPRPSTAPSVQTTYS